MKPDDIYALLKNHYEYFGDKYVDESFKTVSIFLSKIINNLQKTIDELEHRIILLERNIKHLNKK